MDDILYINKFHEEYIHTEWLRGFHRDFNIAGYTVKTKQELVDDINQKIVNKDIDIETVEVHLRRWMYQGRKS